MASISACPPPPYSRTSGAELAHIGSAAKQEVPAPVDLQAWELGTLTETLETVSMSLEVSDTSGQVAQSTVAEQGDSVAAVVESGMG